MRFLPVLRTSLLACALAATAPGQLPPPPLPSPAPEASPAADSPTPAPSATPAPTSLRIRAMTGNLTSGRQQSYDPGHGSRIFQGLKPDVALIQETNAGGGRDDGPAKAWMRSVFGPDFSFYREDGEIPNAIASRWKIVASGEWDDPQVTNRDFAWARVDLPGTRDLWLISVHLLTRSEDERAKEADILLKLVQKNIPPRDYILLGGDLNTKARNERCIARLGAEFVTAGPFPTDEAGSEGTNASRRYPYDWLLADKDLAACEVPLQIGAKSFAHGLVFDSRVFKDLAAVSPVQPEDCAVEGMQHMAVIREFVIPVSEAAP